MPPLNYDRVYRLKQEFPDSTIVLNGGIANAEQASSHLERVDGVMIGRQAYHEPYVLTKLERSLIDADWRPPSRQEVVESMIRYTERQMPTGAELKHISRHLLGLFAGQPGARAWRRYLSEKAHRSGAGVEVLRDALTRLPKAA